MHICHLTCLRQSFIRKIIVAFTLLVAAAPALGETPVKPAQLKYSVYSGTSAEIMWNRATDEVLVVAYEISQNNQVIETSDTLSYYTNDLVKGTTYEFSVIAINQVGNRSEPATVSFVAGDRDTDGPGPDSLAAPTGVQALAYSKRTIEVFWDRVTQETLSYEILIDGEVAGTSNGTSWLTRDLQAGQTYTVSVVAINASGDRSAESSVQVTTRGSVNPDEPGNPFVSDPSDIIDVDAFYDQDGYDTVDVIRVDIKTNTEEGVCDEEDVSGCTLDDVIGDIDGDDDFKAEIKVHFQSDDFADDGSSNNATLRQRGASSRLAPQKSFRIKLDSKEVLWRNERRLQLNKHPNESSRIRNKVSFDLLRSLPHIPSLRTQFVNLWIDDGQGPEDYGLFTHVEFAGKEYLSNRGRDTDDNLYKIEFLEFSQGDLDNIQVDSDGKPLDDDRFESRLQIERGEDHRKVVEMLTALNDPDKSFESVLKQYFNSNNVLTWITANLLLHATDAITNNFYLYNPKGSDKFYFLPWDYDATFHPEQTLTDSLENDELAKRLFYGYARGVNSQFITRYYQQPGIHQKILAAANELRNTYLTDSNINERALRYSTVIEPYLIREPDSIYNPNYSTRRASQFAASVASIHEALQNDFGIPVPPRLNAPKLDGDRLTFSWSPAFDVTGENTMSYELLVSTSVNFEAGDIVVNETNLGDVVNYELSASDLPTGELYVRVIARGSSDPMNIWQVAENTAKLNGTEWYGMRRFKLP